MNEKVSVVIAAFNEATRIANVLQAVQHHPLIDEVIVINDGSADNTSEIVKQFDVTLIENEHNMGKTLTVKRGIEAARNNLIMMLDADLKGLDEESITNLIKPVVDKQVDWTLSLRGNSFGYMRFFQMDWVSGERVIPKEMLMDPYVWSRPDVGYGLETLMNKSFLDKNKTFISVYLPNLKVTSKAEKIGLIGGWVGEYKMVKQITRVMPLHKVIGQFITMARLNKKYRKQIAEKSSQTTTA